MLSIELLTGSGPETLEPLREPWRELWRRDPTATPFQHPDWLLAWWRHLGRGPLRTVALRRSGDLAGVLPMMREEARWILLGAGTSDYLGGVFDPEGARSLVREAVAWIGARLPPGECCAWHQLREDSPLLDDLRESVESESCQAVSLPAEDRAFDATLPSSLRRDLRRGTRFRVEEASPGEAAERFDALARLHGAEWSRRGQRGVLADERVRRAHRECLPSMIEDGAARLFTLCRGGRAVAVHYGLSDPPRPGRRAYFYLGGFDPEAASSSPGSLLIRHAIARAIADGCSWFDFLRGRERYKERWGARPQRTRVRTLQPAP